MLNLIGSMLCLIPILLGGWGCGTDLPTSGQDIWGRNEEELQLIPIGATISKIVADPQRPYLYIADFDNSLVHFISSATREIEKSLAVGSRPSDLALSMDGSQLYVSLLGGAEVAVIDLNRQEEMDRIRLDFSPAYVVSGRPPYLFVSATLELSTNFEEDGETRMINVDSGRVEKVIPPVGLIETNELGSWFYIAVLDRVYQYDIATNDKIIYRNQEETGGPVVEMHLGRGGQRLYTISAGPLTTAAQIIKDGLIDSRANVDTDVVEVFDTDGLIKVGELHAGAFPRAIASSDDVVAVAASDLRRGNRTSGFVTTFDPVTMKALETHRLVGAPTGPAAIDPNTGLLYVAVDNPYDIREHFGDRQDLQIVSLNAPARVEGSARPPARSGASPVPKEITVDLPGGEAMEFVWIEPGSFMMGAVEEEAAMIPIGQKAREYPIHEVTITRGYYLGRYEVTQGQWEAIMGTSPWLGMNYVLAEPDHPVVYISWNDAQDLALRLNELEGREVYRLPTEAEWEYACRAGTRTRWSYGNQMNLHDDYAWFRKNTWESGRPWAQPVGSKLPNPWGLYDMHGNAWEWVHDWLGTYQEEPQVDPVGPLTGTLRVVRGGVFMQPPPAHRSAYRFGGAQFFPDGAVGTRLVRQEPRDF
jgi:formylglycine-generating enzyme required for sulfatase activity